MTERAVSIMANAIGWTLEGEPLDEDMVLVPEERAQAYKRAARRALMQVNGLLVDPEEWATVIDLLSRVMDVEESRVDLHHAMPVDLTDEIETFLEEHGRD